MDIPLSNAIGSLRRAPYVFTESNASVQIPPWAQSGKAFLIVNGVGPGGSGAIRTASGFTGGGGGAGGVAKDIRIRIPAATSTMAIAIGAPGSPVTAAAATAGTAGGTTTITVAGLTLSLQGGAGGLSSGEGGRGGAAYFGNLDLLTSAYVQPAGGIGVSFDNNAIRRGSIETAGLIIGATGWSGGSTPFGSGALSPYGAPGPGLTVGPTANTNGSGASGFGAGGSGALWLAGGSVSSGAGAPSILYVELVEGS